MKCDCHTFYLFGENPQCLHELFKSGLVQIVTKEVLYDGKVEFCIFRDKPKDGSKAWKNKWWRTGMQSRLRTNREVLLAVELAWKYNIRRVNL